MNKLHNRLTQLEKQTQPQGAAVVYPKGYYERGIQTLADILTDITGQAVTTAETMEALRHVKPTQPN